MTAIYQHDYPWRTDVRLYSFTHSHAHVHVLYTYTCTCTITGAPIICFHGAFLRGSHMCGTQMVWKADRAHTHTHMKVSTYVVMEARPVTQSHSMCVRRPSWPHACVHVDMYRLDALPPTSHPGHGIRWNAGLNGITALPNRWRLVRSQRQSLEISTRAITDWLSLKLQGITIGMHSNRGWVSWKLAGFRVYPHQAF